MHLSPASFSQPRRPTPAPPRTQRQLAATLASVAINSYGFKFRHIFPQDCQQSDVFDVVAKPVVNSVLDGYNGTIFAYGILDLGLIWTTSRACFGSLSP